MIQEIKIGGEKFKYGGSCFDKIYLAQDSFFTLELITVEYFDGSMNWSVGTPTKASPCSVSPPTTNSEFQV
jgi:hypothetical protein